MRGVCVPIFIRSHVIWPGQGANFDFSVYFDADDGWLPPVWLGADQGGPRMTILPMNPIEHAISIQEDKDNGLDKTFYCVVCEAAKSAGE